jgi:hypothetical protein
MSAPTRRILPPIYEPALLTLNLLPTTIVAPPSNVSKWQMGFNSAFKGLNKGHSLRRLTATLGIGVGT